MKAQSLHALSDPELLAARHAWEQRLQDLFDGRLADTPFYLQGISCAGKTDMYDDPARRAREALEEVAEQAGKVKDPKVFRPPTVNSGVHGVHFVDRIFGARVYELHGEEGNWQAEYLSSPVGALETPDLDADPTWQALTAFARAFAAGGVTVPVFQLPTIASVLNIGLNLYGQRLLEAMLADPSAARRDLEVINAVLLYMHDWYRANIPADLLQHVASTGRHQPPGHGQICGCSTHLLSGDQYREFVAAHDDAILSRYPKGGMIHLCGCHTQHIDAWRDMRSLKAIQLNDRAAEDLEIYLREIPEKVYYVNPCEGMPLERVERLARAHKIVVVAEPAKQ